jgi:hypothetical protein
MEDGLIEVQTMRRFAGIDMISDQIPDETTILTFRHPLEKHNSANRSLRWSKRFSPHTGRWPGRCPRPWPSGHLQPQLTQRFTLSLQLEALQHSLKLPKQF